MHDSARRLYEAVKAITGIEGLSDVARSLGASTQTVKNWEARGVSKEGMLLARSKLGIDPNWLATGQGHVTFSSQNVTKVELRAKVPLISWVQAGAFQGVEDVFHPGESDVTEDVYDATVSSNAFALRVDGDSMESTYPGDRTFPQGTILIVDPNRGATAGDYVIAKDVSTQRATFKKLVHDGGRWFLKPLNPAYPTIEIDDPALRIIGKVVEFSMRGKLP